MYPTVVQVASAVASHSSAAVTLVKASFVPYNPVSRQGYGILKDVAAFSDSVQVCDATKA